MEKMDVAKDPSVKMKGEDLAHAYDAVRVANKSVSQHQLIPSFWQSTSFQFCAVIYIWWMSSLLVILSLIYMSVCVCVCVSGFWRASYVTSAVSGRRNWKL